MILFLQVSNKIFLKEISACERGTSYAEMNRAGCSNAKKGPKKDYNAFNDFHASETTAHILASWIHFTGMENMEG